MHYLWAYQLVMKGLYDFLVAKECGGLWLLGGLPSAVQLGNSIASNLTPSVLLRKVQHSAVVQWVGFFLTCD